MSKTSSTLIAFLLATTTSVGIAGTSLGQCDAEWKGTYYSGTNGTIYALASHDPDGAGPEVEQLVVGGSFSIAGETAVSNVALWDGATWSPIGAPTGTNGQVNAIVSFDLDGAGPDAPVIIIGGTFTTVGGVAAERVAIWNGSAWSPIPHGPGQGIAGTVNALAVFDDDDAGPNPPALFIGGSFTFAGGFTANNIVKWDGTSWTALGSPAGVDAAVRALTVYDADDEGPGSPELIVGGDFENAGPGLSAKRIASWDGTAWSSLSSFMNNSVYALTVFDMDGDGPNAPLLFAGGSFSGKVQRWNGSGWGAAGTPEIGAGTVFGLIGFTPSGLGATPALYAVGDFSTLSNGSLVYRVAKLEDTTWSRLPSVRGIGFSSRANVAIVHDFDGEGPIEESLVFGGAFSSAGNVGAQKIAAHDASQWIEWPTPSGKLGGISNGDSIFSMTLHDAPGGNDHPDLYVGGRFAAIGTTFSYGVAQWDGDRWNSISTYNPGDHEVHGLASIDVDGPGPIPRQLVACGFFVSMAGLNTSNIIKWDGATWSALDGAPNGIGARLNAIAAFDEDGPGPGHERLFIGGRSSSIRRWDGANLTSIGTIAGASPLEVYSMITWDDDGPGPNPEALYVAGDFDSVNGVLAGGIAKWDGTNWSALVGPLGIGVTGSVQALAVHDEDGAGPDLPKLFVGGTFAQAGGVTVNNVARWGGSGWSALTGTNGTGVNNFVRALASLDDDGPGPNPPSLLMAGALSMAGTVPAYGSCRWDGTRWWALTGPNGNGVSGGSNGILRGCLIAHDDDGPGPRPEVVFAGGGFALAGGVSAERIARWGRDYVLGAGNLDGSIDGSEIQPFVDVLLAPPATAPGLCLYDFDQDDEVTESDIPYFTSLLVGS